MNFKITSTLQWPAAEIELGMLSPLPELIQLTPQKLVNITYWRSSYS